MSDPAAPATANLGKRALKNTVLILVGGYLQLLRSTLYATQRLNFEIAEIVPESLLLLGLVVLGAHLNAGTGYFLWAYAISYAAATVYFAVVIVGRGIARPHWD